MGTILADFTHIMGDGPQDVDTAAGNAVGFSRSFATGGVRTDQSIVLMFAVRNKGTTPADVLINDVNVGRVTSTAIGAFTTQIITITGGGTEAKAFKATNNVFAITNVSDPDGFQIKSIVCFFHQES